MTPDTTPAWLGVRLGFLDGSDWDTVQMIMGHALQRPNQQGYTGFCVRVTLTTGEMFDGRLRDATLPVAEGDDPCEDVSASFQLLDDDSEPTGMLRVERWKDIQEIGVY